MVNHLPIKQSSSQSHELYEKYKPLCIVNTSFGASYQAILDVALAIERKQAKAT